MKQIDEQIDPMIKHLLLEDDDIADEENRLANETAGAGEGKCAGWETEIHPDLLAVLKRDQVKHWPPSSLKVMKPKETMLKKKKVKKKKVKKKGGKKKGGKKVQRKDVWIPNYEETLQSRKKRTKRGKSDIEKDPTYYPHSDDDEEKESSLPPKKKQRIQGSSNTGFATV